MCVSIFFSHPCPSSPLNTRKHLTAVQFRLLLELDIAGLIGKRSASTTVTDGACPIELPTDSV